MNVQESYSRALEQETLPPSLTIIRVQRADIAKVSALRLAEMSSSLTLRPWGEATGAAGASPGRGDDLLEINIVFAPAATPLEA